MKGIAHFYKLNYDFSTEFAKAHHNGEESENNRRFDWEDELEVKTQVSDIEVTENSDFDLQGEKDGLAFSYVIPDILKFEFIGKNGKKTTMACSNSIVSDYKVVQNDEAIELSVFLEERIPLSNPIPGIYIDVKNFPKDLIG